MLIDDCGIILQVYVVMLDLVLESVFFIIIHLIPRCKGRKEKIMSKIKLLFPALN